MGQARKTPRKKRETKEDVLKKEISAAVNRRTTAKVNDIKTRMEELEGQFKNHFQYHEEGGEHAHTDLEARVDEIERRLVNMIEDLRNEVNRLRGERGESTEESQQPPSSY